MSNSIHSPDCWCSTARRSIRFAKELRAPRGQAIEIVANDIDLNAVHLIEANATRNLPGFRPARTRLPGCTLASNTESTSKPSPACPHPHPAAAATAPNNPSQQRRTVSASASDVSCAPPDPPTRTEMAELTIDAPLYVSVGAEGTQVSPPVSGSGSRATYHPIITSCADAAQCMYMCKNLRPTSKFQVIFRVNTLPVHCTQCLSQ